MNAAALSLPESHATAVEALSHHLAEAMADASEKHRSLSAAEKHRDAIAARVSELNAQRAGIIARRSAGKGEPEDGAALALIAADMEGLNALLPDAAARVAGAKAEFDRSSNQAAALRERIEQAEALAVREKAIPYLGELADKLLAVIKLVEEAGKRAGVGGRPPWGASRELRDRLRALAAQRNEL